MGEGCIEAPCAGFGRIRETHRVSPARARRCPVHRCVLSHQRPAPDPAGEKRPPWAGRAFAVALGATAVSGPSGGGWQRRQPLPWGEVAGHCCTAGPGSGGSGNTRVPPPRRRPGPRSAVRSCNSATGARPCGREASGPGAGAGRGLWGHGRSRTQPAGRRRGVSLIHGRGRWSFGQCCLWSKARGRKISLPIHVGPIPDDPSHVLESSTPCGARHSATRRAPSRRAESSSATRKASSRDCEAFRRGSQAVW
jgi:hypothetical protein